MVRVLLVRHGMTKGNLRSARAAIQVVKGNITPEQMIDYENQQRNGEGLHEWSGDTQLSDVGKEEAELLGQFLGPMLEEAAKRNNLHVYVSPMQRCLETADPLITRLNYKATVLPLIFESPGLCHKYDRDFFCKSVEPLVTSNDMENAIKIYKKHRFRDAGLSQNSIRRSFPWVHECVMFPEDPDKSWYSESNGYRGFEAPKSTLKRANRTAIFLKQQAKALPRNDTILLVSHGNFLGALINSLFGLDDVSHTLNNTSMSSFKILPDGEVIFEFVNRISHLKKSRQSALYESMGFTERRGKSGKKYVDIGELMRNGRGAGSFADSPYGLLLASMEHRESSKL